MYAPMTTIPLVDPAHAPLLARPYLSRENCSQLAATLAHVPELLESAMPFIGALYGPTALPDRLKEIVVVRVSALNGCPYCLRVHGALAAAAGLSSVEIASLGGEADLVPISDETRDGVRSAEASPGEHGAELALRSDEAERGPTLPETALAPNFSKEEGAAIRFAELLCRCPAESIAVLERHFRDDQIVELALLGATTISLNRFCVAMGLS